jgi:hypothetical protein
MIIYFYNILGMMLLVWYSCLRWYIEGNNLGEIVLTDQHITIFKLNWIWTLINLVTAFCSIGFLAKSILFLNNTFTKNIYTLVFLLTIRNIWYAFEDIDQFYKIDHSLKQTLYIIIDIAMIFECLIWFYLYSKKV